MMRLRFNLLDRRVLYGSGIRTLHSLSVRIAAAQLRGCARPGTCVRALIHEMAGHKDGNGHSHDYARHEASEPTCNRTDRALSAIFSVCS